MAGLFAVAPIAANAGDRDKPPPKGADTGCTGWQAEITTITAAQQGWVTVTGNVQAEAGSDGSACQAEPRLLGYKATVHGQHTWSRKGQTTDASLGGLGAFSVTLPFPAETHALCVSQNGVEVLACAGAGARDSGTSPGSAYHVRQLLLPADQTGIWEEPDPNCGTCV